MHDLLDLRIYMHLSFKHFSGGGGDPLVGKSHSVIALVRAPSYSTLVIVQ